MRRTWIGAAVAVVTLASCGVPEETSPRFRDPDEVPFGLTERPPTDTTRPARRPTQLASCFVADGGTVVRRPGTAGPTLLQRLRAPAPPDEELTTALPDPDVVAAATLTGGVAEIDLRDDFADLPATSQRLIAAQLVCSATATPGVGQVRFTLEGSPLSVPRGDGSLTDERLTIDDYTELLEGS